MRANLFHLLCFFAAAYRLGFRDIWSELQGIATVSKLVDPFTEIPPGVAALLTLPAAEASEKAEIMLPCFSVVLGGIAFLLLPFFPWLTSPLTMHGGLASFSVPGDGLSVVPVVAAGQPL